MIDENTKVWGMLFLCVSRIHFHFNTITGTPIITVM